MGGRRERGMEGRRVNEESPLFGPCFFLKQLLTYQCCLRMVICLVFGLPCSFVK